MPERNRGGRKLLGEEKRIPIPFMVTPTELSALDVLAAERKWNRNVLIREAMEAKYPEIFRPITERPL